MHVIVATDGSQQSLRAARHLKSFADPAKIEAISVIAVVRPLAAVAFADDLSPAAKTQAQGESEGFRSAAESAVAAVAKEFEGWGPKVHQKVRSGSPANEIIKAANQLSAGLVVVAAGGRGVSDTVLVGSTAQRVQHYAPCPVLVVRPAPRRTRK
jgi:nucleotide-binding universal stress UspA family protein